MFGTSATWGYEEGPWLTYRTSLWLQEGRSENTETVTQDGPSRKL